MRPHGAVRCLHHARIERPFIHKTIIGGVNCFPDAGKRYKLISEVLGAQALHILAKLFGILLLERAATILRRLGKRSFVAPPTGRSRRSD